MTDIVVVSEAPKTVIVENTQTNVIDVIWPGPVGPQGPAGTAGTAASIAVGTVTTGAAGSAATVTNVGTSSAAVFNFSIPQGLKGDKGDTGNKGDTGSPGVGVPAGGATGQILSKQSSTDYDTVWIAAPASGVSTFNTRSGAVTLLSSDVTTALGYTPANNASLASVAFSGAYADLTGKPTIPTAVSQLTNDANYITTAEARSAISVAGSLAYNSSTGVISYTAPTLAPVATTGAYADLTGTPTIPTKTSDLTNDSGFITTSGARTAVSAGTGISYNSTTGVITNSAPDQTVTLTNGGGISVTGSYPNFTLTATGGAGIGTVTSVDVSGGTTGLSFSGGPITSSGTITLAGTLSVASGGTGVTTSTGSGSVVLSNSPTLVTPNLGTPSAAILTNATGLPITTGTVGTLPVGRGGTGISGATPANGQLLIGDGGGFSLSTLTAGSGVTITNTAGNITISAGGTGGLAGVTSAAYPYTVALGTNAGTSISTGNSNTFLGFASGQNNDGSGNIAIGESAMQSNYSGSLNVAIGTSALRNGDGSNNVAIGDSAMRNADGNENVGIGDTVMYSVTTGYRNMGLGYQAMYSMTTGIGNVGIGHNGARSITTGENNVAIGRSAAYTLTTGNNNIVIGAYAEPSSASASNEITIGSSSNFKTRLFGDLRPGGTNPGTVGQVLTSQGPNTPPTWTTISGGGGVSSLNSATGAVTIAAGSNVTVSTVGSTITISATGGGGSLLGQTDSATPFETSLGYQAGNVSTGTATTFVGYQAGLANSTGNSNTAIGYRALYTNTTGEANVAIGTNALGLNVTSSANVAIGHLAAEKTTAQRNVAIGWVALTNNTSGQTNCAVGALSLNSSTTASNNSAFGASAGRFITTGTYNVGLGTSSLSGLTSGSSNIGIGQDSLAGVSTGSFNVGIGYSTLGGGSAAARNVAIGYQAGSSTNSSDCVYTGYRAAYLLNSGVQNVIIGASSATTLAYGSNDIIIGYGAEPSTTSIDNEITLGNSSITTLRCQVTSITALSDARDKTDIIPLAAGLGFVNALNPVAFTWNMRDGGKVGQADTGFIAQELKAAQEETGINIPGLVYESNPERLEAAYGKLIPVLVKAIQELSAELAELKAKVN